MKDFIFVIVLEFYQSHILYPDILCDIKCTPGHHMWTADLCNIIGNKEKQG